MSAVEKFPILLSEAEEESSAVPPCFSDEGINVRLSQRQAKTSCPLFLSKCTVLLPLNGATLPQGPFYLNYFTDIESSVPLYPPQQSVSPRTYEAKYECRRDSPFPPQNR